MVTPNELHARVLHGVGILTAYVTRDASTGDVGRPLLAALVGEELDDEVLAEALASVMIVSEMAILMLLQGSGKTPQDALQVLAAHQGRRT